MTCSNRSRSIDPYENLANAIVLQAANDYRAANKALARNRENAEARISREKLLEFFNSRWFSVLTTLDPEYLVSQLDKEVNL